MKLLLDACIGRWAKEALEVAGHDVAWVGEWPEDPGDSAVLSVAHAERRILVTLDRDFGELAVLQGQAHSGIIRLVNAPARQHAPICIQVLDKHAAELLLGSIATVEPGRVRIRRPDE